MNQPLLGRTNEAWPDVWFRLEPPTESGQLQPLLDAAIESGSPLDISAVPALFGGRLRSEDYVTMGRSSLDYAEATDHNHALNLLQAHLIETLSAIGRERIDFYFLRVRNVVEEFQIAGVLEALEMARQEGHIRFLGIACEGPALATLNVWQFHDAFDVLLVSDTGAWSTLSPLAKERRVGVVTEGPSRFEGSPRILAVRSAKQIQEAFI